MKSTFLTGAIALLAMPFLLSCEKNKEEVAALQSGSDYLVFGSYFGHCLGENCIQIFKLENNKLYEDTRDAYPTEFYTTGYQGAWKELPAEKYALARELPAAFPADLLTVRDTTIGMPDFADGGGLYAEIRDENGKKRYWFIDNMDENVPAGLHAFSAAIRTTVARIREE